MRISEFDCTMNLLIDFFRTQQFTMIDTDTSRSILKACEDPNTIAKFSISNEMWPLQQTGQMELEKVLLLNPDIKGVYCISTSYRDEPNIIEGRHDIIFKMVEFESFGTIDDLINLETALLKHLGFNEPSFNLTYLDATTRYNSSVLMAEHETFIQRDFGNVVFLKYFPEISQPFWNMKRNSGGTYNKVDVLLYGMETIGSAERSCSPSEMMEDFLGVSEGQYAQKLFQLFGSERVMNELDEYLKLDMVPRFGGGIGVNRLIRAMKLEGILCAQKNNFQK
jgi:aspartyl/asparaginyl-tRNA synthetase